MMGVSVACMGGLNQAGRLQEHLGIVRPRASATTVNDNSVIRQPPVNYERSLRVAVSHSSCTSASNTATGLQAPGTQ